MGLSEDLLERGMGEVEGDVEDGAGGGGDGDAFAARGLVGRKVAGSVDADPGLGAGVRAGDAEVDEIGSCWVGEELVEGGGALMTEDSPWTDRETCGHLILERLSDRADAIHAAADGDEPASSQPTIDHAAIQAQSEQLGAGD